MKKRMCRWQGVMLETRLNIHLSRCENPDSPNYLAPAAKEVCSLCAHKMAVEGPDELAESLVEVFGAEVSEQSAETLADLKTHYCVECVQKRGGK